MPLATLSLTAIRLVTHASCYTFSYCNKTGNPCLLLQFLLLLKAFTQDTSHDNIENRVNTTLSFLTTLQYLHLWFDCVKTGVPSVDFSWLAQFSVLPPSPCNMQHNISIEHVDTVFTEVSQTDRSKCSQNWRSLFQINCLHLYIPKKSEPTVSNLLYTLNITYKV